MFCLFVCVGIPLFRIQHFLVDLYSLRILVKIIYVSFIFACGVVTRCYDLYLTHQQSRYITVEWAIGLIDYWSNLCIYILALDFEVLSCCKSCVFCRLIVRVYNMGECLFVKAGLALLEGLRRLEIGSSGRAGALNGVIWRGWCWN